MPIARCIVLRVLRLYCELDALTLVLFSHLDRSGREAHVGRVQNSTGRLGATDGQT